MEICSWNINGAFSKLDDLLFLHNFDIISISEIKHAYVFALPGFNMIRSSVVEGEEHRGGVALFYRHDLAQHLHHIERSVDQVWFQLTFMPDTWWGACYIPPRDSPFFRNDSFSRIQEYCAKGKVIIMGDLNSRLPNLTVFNSLDVYYSENPDKGTNQNGNDLQSICTDYNLVPLNHRNAPNHTFEGGMTFRQGQLWVSQLDWMFCSSALADAFQSLTIHRGFRQSNHAPLSTELTIPKEGSEQIYKRASALGSHYEMSPNPYKKPIQFNSLDLTRFALPDPADLNLNSTDVNSLASAISELTYEACRHAKQRVLPTENTHNRIAEDRWKRILRTHDDKELWKAVGWDGRVFNSSYCEERPSDEDFEKHFKALLNPENEPLEIPWHGPYIPELDDDITPMEVTREIQKAKSGKAPGIDGVPPGILKSYPQSWIALLTSLFNAVFQSGQYPTEWSIAKLFTVYKKGPRSDPRNYRGISVISFLAKLYDPILNSRLSRWFKPDVEQAGAQKHRGCCEQLLTLRLLVDFARHSKQTLFVTFVDFRQAYDRVPRRRLIEILQQQGCGQRMLSALVSGLSDTRSLLNTIMVDSSIGVRQGGSSSCFLFTLFVNPLTRALNALGPDGFLENHHVLLLMDDTVIFASSRERMQTKLDTLHEYCAQHGMQVNVSKTKFIAINADNDMPFRLGDLNIESTDTYVYLGSPIMNSSITDQVKKHVQMKMSARRKFSSFLSRNDDAPFHVKRKVWDAALNSAILYSCETWMCLDIKCVEKVYMATLKEMLGVRTQTPNDLCLIESGIAPIKPRIRSRQIDFLQKLERLEHFEGSPIQFALNISSQCPTGRYIASLRQNRDGNIVASAINQIRDKCRNSEASKTRTYVSLMNPELSDVPVYNRSHSVPEHQRKAFTRLRLSSHKLRIETGRWSRTPREERLCHCSNRIQSEEHAVCDCIVTQPIRDEYPNVDFSNLSSFFSCESLYLQCLIAYRCLKKLNAY